ncbi:hypothetical protein [Thalassococcus lentus]|uniref:Uncharacterized protein n=1 Tax=Thalassococcus lentus TaxID=1210524 RepID=A0ABT4XQH6_9RHOB|nr:hypothetical protein [Thalassococcus lentus]MDA7424108.1 hypothetical protein [Thalassococcus lentus]
MNSFFEPDPVLLGFIFYKKFIYLQLLCLLALLRVIGGYGIARWPALLTLLMAGAGVYTVFAPALGLNSGAIYTNTAQFMAEGGGLAALLVPSGIFALCGLIPRARWRWIDAIHALMVIVLLGLWWWTS